MGSVHRFHGSVHLPQANLRHPQRRIGYRDGWVTGDDILQEGGRSLPLTGPQEFYRLLEIDRFVGQRFPHVFIDCERVTELPSSARSGPARKARFEANPRSPFTKVIAFHPLWREWAGSQRATCLASAYNCGGGMRRCTVPNRPEHPLGRANPSPL